MITYIKNKFKLDEETLTDQKALKHFKDGVQDWELSAYRAISSLLDKLKIESGDEDNYEYIETRDEISLANLDCDVENDIFKLFLWDKNDRRIYVACERNLPRGGNYLEEVYSLLCTTKTKYESWHTLEMLMLARAAHRENTANNRFKFPYNPTKSEFDEYLSDSRKADVLHHSVETF